MSTREVQERSVQTSHGWTQGVIRGLDDAMTKRLVASTVMTESAGGNLAVTNRQGYVGRYQAGAGWLADAGFVSGQKLHEQMKRDGFTSEWKWSQSGGMTRFLEDSTNWTSGLSLSQYKASAGLQDRAFKANCDAAVQSEIKRGGLTTDSEPRLVAAFLKARHISGLGGAEMALQGRQGPADINGTSNLTYFNHVQQNRDGLDALMDVPTRGHRSSRTMEAIAPGSNHATQHPHGAQPYHHDVRSEQSALAHLGYTGEDGRLVHADGVIGRNTRHAIRQFQADHALPATGRLDEGALSVIAAQERTMASTTHPAHVLYRESLSAVQALDRSMGIPSGLHSIALAGVAAFEAAQPGLTRVDRVELGTDRSHVRAVQFSRGVDDWTTNRTSAPFEVARAVTQPLEVSSQHASRAIDSQALVSEQSVRQHAPMRSPVL